MHSFTDGSEPPPQNIKSYLTLDKYNYIFTNFLARRCPGKIFVFLVNIFVENVISSNYNIDVTNYNHLDEQMKFSFFVSWKKIMC